MAQMTVDEYLAAIRRGGEEGEEAARALEALLEDLPEDRAVTLKHPQRQFSERERDAAVRGLIRYVEEVAEPDAMAVWALTKAYDARSILALLGLLDRCLGRPEAEHLAYQALQGLLTTGASDPEWHERVFAMVRRAAHEGQGEVKDTAVEYLRANGLQR